MATGSTSAAAGPECPTETEGGHVSLDDGAAMEARMDAIRLKQILGEPLTEQELMCLQIEQNGFGCQTCAKEPPPPSTNEGSIPI